MGNLRMNADQISYKGGNKPMSVEEAIKNAGNTGLAHTADIAPDFSTETSYSAGDFVYHNGSLYVFTANHAAGAWSTDDTQAVTVGGEIATLSGDAADLNINKANQITIAPFFNAEESYDPGDLVYYNGLSYRCVNAHEGAWDADDFAATTIANELSSLESGLTVKTATVSDEHFSSVTVTEVGGVKSLYIATTGADTALDTTADYVEYFTLPAGFRPATLYYNRFVSKKSAAAADTDWVIRIDTTGKVSLVNYSGEEHPGFANTFVFI